MVKLQKNINSIENIKSGNSVNHLTTLILKELIYKHPTQNSKPETEANLETRKQNTLLQDLLLLLLSFKKKKPESLSLSKRNNFGNTQKFKTEKTPISTAKPKTTGLKKNNG